MDRSTSTVLKLAQPVKAWIQRSALLLLVTAAVALMLLGRTQSGVVDTARALVADAVAPMLDFASRPISTTVDTLERAQNLMALAKENAQLREANRRLRSWQAVAYRLEAENGALRDLLRMAPDPGSRYVTARVVADNGGAFVRSVLVSAGRRDGVVQGQAAVTGEGLAGRVAQVGARAAQVLLITDMNSRIPVMLAHSRERAVLAGNNTNRPALLYLGPRSQVEPGDRILTSGDGGVFPAGLPVGVVAASDDGRVRVQPFVDWDRMEYLRLIDFELPGLLLSAGDDH
ncbi:MAG: rod shape-determining protein MreC [Kiloniellales bacterium]|nr:rod shape-determining protein MreC [Kiloniellales bacterium]